MKYSIIFESTVLDTKIGLRQKMNPDKWSMLNADYHTFFNEIILNLSYNN